MVTVDITLVIHHRGRFQKRDDKRLVYEGGEVSEVERVNVDTLNKFFIHDLLKNIGYTEVSEFYWLEPGREIEGGLRLLRMDMDIVRMYEAAVSNGRRIHVYSEHPINIPTFVEGDVQEEATLPAPVPPTMSAEVTPRRIRLKKCVRKTPTPPPQKKKKKRVPIQGDPREEVEAQDVGESPVQTKPATQYRPKTQPKALFQQCEEPSSIPQNNSYPPQTPPAASNTAPPANLIRPMVPQPMQGASRGTTTRFMQFIPTPFVGASSSGARWPSPTFRPPTNISGNGLSSGSSISTPN